MSKTILTIDDSASIRQMVSMTLTSAGLDVIEAINGADGYTKATTNVVHAVITDLNMPVLNGIETLVIGADHDEAGMKAATDCADRWSAAGVDVRVIAPDAESADWNDARCAA